MQPVSCYLQHFFKYCFFLCSDHLFFYVSLHQVQFAAGRDLTPDQLNNMIDTLSDWCVCIIKKCFYIPGNVNAVLTNVSTFQEM